VILKCHKPFGHYEPGAEVEVPDGAEFDTAHFEMTEKPKVKKEDKPDGN
jgi:hypothetical protein